jgi:hypothetical protein
MIREQQSQENAGVRNVSTKVPVWVADLLNIICRARGTDLYGLLQLVIQFIVETAKVNGPVPPQMQTILNMLKMDADWNKAFSFSNPTATMDVAQVILVLQQHDGKTPRQGFGLAMIDKPFLPGETPQMTLCVDDILERVAEVSMKGLYKELRQVGVAYETESLRETLTMMCDAQLIDHLNQMDRDELPQVGNFNDFGKAIEYGKKHKRKPHRTPDSVANSQQKIIFDDFDRDTAHAEVQDWEGEHIGQHVSPEEIERAIGGKPFGIET